MNYWLLKTEPETYSWDDLLKQKVGTWDGVRNYAARNNLRAMKKGDLAFFYHSGETRDIVGIVKIVAEAFPDPTAREGDWSAVKVSPVQKLKTPITLQMIKKDAVLSQMSIVKRGRLSVSPVAKKEYEKIIKFGSK
jgi:predicted RNA-binding protein with PUA-like domain